MKKIILALLFPVLVLAQDYQLGKVTIAELSQKQHPTDTSAAAAVLYKKGGSYFVYSKEEGFNLFTEVEAKIKIYKKEGLDLANKTIVYYIGGASEESVTINKSITYNLVNGKIEKTKLNGDGEFKEKINKFWASKKITMPNVKVGSIIEYNYTIKSSYISNIPDWQFQETIPVNYSEFETRIPDYFVFNYYNRGFLTPEIASLSTEKTVVFTDKHRVGPTLSSTGAATTTYSDSSINYKELKTTFKMMNLPALKEESYSNSIQNFLSGVQYELASIKYPNQLPEMYAQSWDGVVKSIYESEGFGLELEKESYFENDLNKLISDSKLTQIEKTNIIYDFVKKKLKWNDFTGIYTDNGVKKAYQEGVGNIADINLILVAMLRKAGVEANPVLLTTRNKAINLFPSKTAFNYLICGVEIDGNLIFLDASNKNLKPNLLPDMALNYIGRIVRKNGTSSIVDLSPKTHSKNSVMIFASVDNQLIKGNITEILTENRAYNFRDKYNSVSEDSYLENIEKNNLGFEISDYKIENKTNENESIKEDYSFSASNEVEVINDKLFFKPLLFFAIDENPFKQDKRNYPIDFKYPTHDSYTITYNLPQGYVVESMPEKTNIAIEDNLASFSFLIGNTGNKIQIVSNFHINSALISSEYYDSLKAFFNLVFLKMNEKIVLKKQ